MNKEIQDKIFAKYPAIFRQKDLPITETCLCWGLECSEGWAKIIDNLSGAIQYTIENCQTSITLKNEKTETYTKHNGEEISYQTAFELVKYPAVEFVQVKQKFGTLRVYWDMVPFTPEFAETLNETALKEFYIRYRSAIEGMISFAEYLSSITCEDCGADGKLSTNPFGWYRTVCEKCAVEKDFKPCK